MPVYTTGYVGGTLVNIKTATTTLVKTGPGTLFSISVNKGGAGSDMKIYDGIDATGTLLGTFSTTAQTFLPLGWSFLVGLCIVTEAGTAADITVTYA